MIFKYTKEWEEKLLKYASNGANLEKEEWHILDNLIDEANRSDDVRAVEALVHVLYYEHYSIDQSVYGILSTINYKIFYEGVFKKLNTLDLEKAYNLENIILVLHQIDGTDINLKVRTQLKDILELADKYLDLKTVKILRDEIEMWGYEEDDEKLFRYLNDYFNQRINGIRK
jgi:hypothetical protein